LFALIFRKIDSFASRSVSNELMLPNVFRNLDCTYKTVGVKYGLFVDLQMILGVSNSFHTHRHKYHSLDDEKQIFFCNSHPLFDK